MWYVINGYRIFMTSQLSIEEALNKEEKVRTTKMSSNHGRGFSCN